jgi:Putative sugar-binding domain
MVRPRRDPVDAAGNLAAEWLEHTRATARSSGSRGARPCRPWRRWRSTSRAGWRSCSWSAACSCTPTPCATRCSPNRPSVRSWRGPGAADIALVGIGALGVGSTDQVLDGLDLTAAERAAFLGQNPVGDTCCRFFDADGRPVVGVVHDRVLAVDLDDLRHIPTVIGVAAGPEKATSVHAALRGGIVDRLITDAALAHAVLTAAGVL